MEIQALGYLGFGAGDLEDWTDFATARLGMQAVDRGAGLRAFRMDDRRQRLVGLWRASDADGARDGEVAHMR